MTIFSDEVLMLTAAEMEEWYEHELLLRSEHELRQKRVHGGGSVGTVSIAGLVGDILANNNMLPSPTDFNGQNYFQIGGAVGWTKTHSSILTPITLANIPATRPDGSVTQKLVEDSTNNQHQLVPFSDGGLSPQVTNLFHVVLRSAFLIRPQERTRCVTFIQAIDNTGTLFSTVSAGFDLVAMSSFDNTTSGSGWTFLAANVTPAAGGYVLCTLDAVNTEGNQPHFVFYRSPIVLDNGTGSTPRSITYTGDGNSGALIWWASLMPKGAWALNFSPAFFDDFTSINTIDINDTRKPGFNWYVHNLFPNCSVTNFGLVTNPPSGPTPQAAISVANSKVTLSNANAIPADAGFTSQLWSVAYTGDIGGGPNGFRGTVYKIPAFYEANMGYDAPTMHNPGTSAGVPAIWGLTIEGIIGTQNQFVELDCVEAGNQSFGDAMHMWTGPNTNTNHCATGLTGNSYISAAWNPAVTDITQQSMNRYGCLLLDNLSNDGTWGVFMTFYNGHWWGNCTVFSTNNSSIPPSPQLGGGPANPVGAYSQLFTQRLTMFFNTGELPAVRMDVDWIKLYLASPAQLTVQ